MLTILLILYLCRQKYTASAHGSTRVRVNCKSCGKSYAYRLERTARRTRHAQMLGSLNEYDKERVDDDVEFDLEDKLRHDFECIPCVHCGDYQPNMVKRLQAEKFQWLRDLAWIPFLLGSLGLFAGIIIGLIELVNHEDQTSENFTIGMVLLATAAGTTFVGLGTGIWMRVSHPRCVEEYDPNDPNGADERFELAQEFARPVDGRPKRPPVIKPIDSRW